MSYGLYDADLPYYPIPFYNLELMKLSSYYKRKREIVGLSPDFSPQRYSHFIIRQDFYNPYSQIKPTPDIEIGGRAFDGEKYKPLPLEIEIMKPDISLYGKLNPQKIRGYNVHALNTMRRAEHVRLSLDGKTIWKDFEKQFRYDSNAHGIIFHDYDLNLIKDADKIIQEILPNTIKHTAGRRIGMKFPVKVNNKIDLFKWLNFKPMGTYYSLTYNGLIDNSYIPELVDIKQQVATLKQTSIDISNCFSNKDLINGGLQRILRSVINLRSYQLIFPLIYNENVLISDEWKKVLQLIIHYNQHLLSIKNPKFFNLIEPYETIYSYCKSAIKNYGVKDPFFTKDNIVPIFQFVRENDYNLFRDFYEYRGGEVKNDR